MKILSTCYTKELVSNTFQLVKRAIFVFDIIFQLIYLTYLGFKIANGSSFLIANIVLIVLSFIYFVYFLASTKEFYTTEQKQNRKSARSLTRICKRITDFTIIVLAIIQLYNLPANNIEVLSTLILIGAFVLAIIFDIIKGLIDNRCTLFVSAFNYDIYNFTIEHPKVVKGLNLVKINLPTEKPNIHRKIVAKLKAVAHKTQFRAMRKKDFKNEKLNK